MAAEGDRQVELGRSSRPAVPPAHGARGRSGLRILSVQPDRDHGVIEVIGECGHEGVAELRQRVDGLLIAGARFVLVDLTEAGAAAPSMKSTLASAGRQLARRNGWLRIVGHGWSPSRARYEASLPELFTMYQAAVRNSMSRVARLGISG